MENFLEADSVEAANQVDLGKYTFVGLRKENYCFKIREAKKKSEKSA
jgi:hypothetical protein